MNHPTSLILTEGDREHLETVRQGIADISPVDVRVPSIDDLFAFALACAAHALNPHGDNAMQVQCALDASGIWSHERVTLAVDRYRYHRSNAEETAS